MGEQTAKGWTAGTDKALRIDCWTKLLLKYQHSCDIFKEIYHRTGRKSYK